MLWRRVCDFVAILFFINCVYFESAWAGDQNQKIRQPKTIDQREGGRGFEFLRSLEYDQTIVGLSIPKGWFPEIPHAFAIQTLSIRPDFEGLYSLGWKPLLDLRGITFDGSQQELRSLILQLSQACEMPVLVNGFTTCEGSFPRQSFLVRQGAILAVQ